jgi:hypothetical protein
VKKRVVIDLQLKLLEGQGGTVGRFASDAYVVGHESVNKIQAQADEFQGNAVLAQGINQGTFYKIGQTNLVEPQNEADQSQNEQPHADSAYAETRAPFGPVTGLVAHAAKRSLKWGQSSIKERSKKSANSW